MGKPKLNSEKIARIRFLRQQGYSLGEIREEVEVGYGTVFRYIKDVEILGDYSNYWKQKKGGSVRRMLKAEDLAKSKAKSFITDMTFKEKAIFISALYWGEGNKKDLNFVNSDPLMVKVFIVGLQNIFGITLDRIKVSIRIFEDLDKEECLKFWSQVTNIPVGNFVNIDIKSGRKIGKLPYGMCRIRVLKGAETLKYLKAIYKQVFTFFPCPRSSMDRAQVS